MKTQFSTKGIDLTSELEKYANRKVAHISRRVPRKLRATVDCEVAFARATKKGTKLNTCTITLGIDDVELKACETTQHMYAALDIAAVQIEQQLKDYVRKELGGLLRRHFRTSRYSNL